MDGLFRAAVASKAVIPRARKRVLAPAGRTRGVSAHQAGGRATGVATPIRDPTSAYFGAVFDEILEYRTIKACL